MGNPADEEKQDKVIELLIAQTSMLQQLISQQQPQVPQPDPNIAALAATVETLAEKFDGLSGVVNEIKAGKEASHISEATNTV